tara:strand:- start:75 stop:767 length:693 start_codon:yes stop_codon:yes gene_type:complete
MNKLASGQEGNVYLLNNKKILKHRKINTDDKEFKIQQILYGIVPEHIIKPIDQFRTLNGKPIFLMDYLRAKTFKEFVSNPESFRDFPNIMIELLCKVMTVLDRIYKIYPSFRHNDLHGENIMITEDQSVYIADFGKSRMDLTGVDHMDVYENYGIVPISDPRYDYHFFINNCYLLSPPGSKIKTMIELVIPPEYLGRESPFINNFRLRPYMEHKNLPKRSKLVKIFCAKY